MIPIHDIWNLSTEDNKSCKSKQFYFQNQQWSFWWKFFFHVFFWFPVPLKCMLCHSLWCCLTDSLKRTNCLETEVQKLDYLEHFRVILHARFIFWMSFSLKFQSFCAVIILFSCINCSQGVPENREFGSHEGITRHLQWNIKPYAATYWTKLSRLQQWSAKMQTSFPHY